ncbi:MarR family winged helix-turn-helix transcriptional regulator [Chengkuizengella sp. SCS-71B]|uniref:MarR family winged helix-turn-helix transcriptional regulator n=1 Tax=Chengkuizengella sp. SCS-71B TaxID=3115290 RepID=UPI0032C22BC8
MKSDLNLSLKLFIVLSRATRTISDLAHQDIQSYGLNPTEFAVLDLLYHKGEQPLQKIGEKILIASGSITYVVDKLEEKGYLSRNPNPKDRRIIYAIISEKGKKLFDEIFPKHENKIDEIVNGLSDEEKKEAIFLLKKLGIYAKHIE